MPPETKARISSVSISPEPDSAAVLAARLILSFSLCRKVDPVPETSVMPIRKPETSAPVAALRATVNAQLKRLLLVVAAVVVLAAYAHNFIWDGIKSNIYLNGLIIALFVFGMFVTFTRVLSVRNDAWAFAALEEAYNDMRTERVEAQEDPYWRHYRAMAPGVVFSRPKSIGRMFDLAYDEVLKSKHLKISAATLLNISRGIDIRLAEERSLLNYLTGLLIFLGLIGTFVGLMEMAGPIGSVNSNLTGTSVNPTETMQRFLTDLQKPLSGMAMGFSSSLFGLFSSLTLGLMARFGSRCQSALKENFESWLASTTHLETGKGGDVGELARLIADGLPGVPGEGGSVQGGRAAGGGPAMSDMGMVATMAQGFSRMQTTMETMSASMPKLIEIQAEQIQVSRSILAVLDRLATEGNDTRESGRDLVVLNQGSNEHMQELIVAMRATEQRLTSGFNGMAHVMEVTGQAYLDGLRRLTAENYETNTRLARLLDVKAAGDRIAEIAGSIESKVKDGVGSMSLALERAATALESGMSKMAAEQAELKNVLQQFHANGMGGGASSEFEEKLTSGFTELSRSMETVFAAYAQLVNRSLVANAMGNTESIPAAPSLAVQQQATLREHEAKQQPVKPVVDHDALRRKLYSAAASGMNG